MNKKITSLYILLVAFVIGIAGCTMLTVEELEGILPGTWQSADGVRTYVFSANGTYTDTNNTTTITVNGRWTIESSEGILQTTLKLCENVTGICNVEPYIVGLTLTFTNSNMTMTILTTEYTKQ